MQRDIVVLKADDTVDGEVRHFQKVPSFTSHLGVQRTKGGILAILDMISKLPFYKQINLYN